MHEVARDLKEKRPAASSRPAVFITLRNRALRCAHCMSRGRPLPASAAVEPTSAVAAATVEAAAVKSAAAMVGRPSMSRETMS